ncbi:hypothetical protein BDW75DRAFT_224417 [Aspergillus navahoensis]
MSPAPLAVDSQPDRQLKILARAFEALLLTTQQFSSKEKILHQRLEYAHDEYLKLADRTPQGLDPHTKIVAEKIFGRRVEFDNLPKQSLNPMDVVKDLSESGNVGDSSLAAITEGVGIYKSFLGPDDGSTGVVATRAGSLERDFTTKGTRGSLRCPFSKPHSLSSENGVNGIETTLPSQNGDTCGFQHLDPIKEEQMERRSSQAPSASVRSSNRCPASRCPIRFLDQHSPEEIADYVERHKHEIPRSHAICVKRYSNSSRQLDAKYGDLTNMIRGLSQKHQAFLPGRRSSQTASSSAERVEKWAEEVKPQTPTEEDEAIENNEDRKGHFDRPLRDVRVGESPSRPWGIHVPIPPPAIEPITQSLPVVDHALDKPLNDSTTGALKARCPFGHGGGVPPPDQPAIETETVHKEPVTSDATSTNEVKQTETQNPPNPSPASIVFNGPVFFGFSPEQTATFMQQLASLGHNKL